MKSINYSVDAISQRLKTYQAQLLANTASRDAAVALVLRDGADGAEVLFIRRAIAEQDPWSGQIAFPGGGLESADKDLVDTATRETREELGLHLERDTLVTALMDQQGSNRTGRIDLRVRCMIFALQGSNSRQQLKPNYEVAEAFWTPLKYLTDSRHVIEFETPLATGVRTGIDLGSGSHGEKKILWGLTYRFFQHFVEAIRATP